MYHASGKPYLHTGSIVKVPPNPKATRPYGSGISATPYALESASGWSPRLLRDVESKYGQKRARREARRTTGKPATVRVLGPSNREVADIARAHERAIAGNIGNIE